MANRILKKTKVIDEIYTPGLIKRAVGKQCAICYRYISEEEANNKEFDYSQRKNKHEIFVHMRCWNKAYQA